MKKGIVAAVLSSVVMWLLLCPQLAARPPGKKAPPPDRQIGIDSHTSDRPHADRAGFFVSAALDTYVLAEFDFDTPGTPEQGWQTVDATAQPGTFFHVDDFSGLGGGSSGGLRPFTGQKSLWCGTRHHPEYTECPGCYPGYGDSWDQRFESRVFPSSGDVIVSFQIRYDSEAADVTTLEYYDGFGYWVTLLSFDGEGELLVTKIIPEENLPGYVRIRFRFVSDSRWSDGDCVYPTDGAAIIDELIIRDATGLLDSQDFEAESVGATATADGDWTAQVLPAFGDYAALYPGIAVLQEDYCVFNTSLLWGFFDDPAITEYDCSFPQPQPPQGAIPYGNADGQYMNNQVWSPLINREVDKNGTPVPSSASSAVLEFDVYRDLPLDAMLFYRWSVRSFIDGCPSEWRDRNFVYFGGQKNWFRARFEIADLISPGADQVQIALGCQDGCAFGWCFLEECHTQGPLFDNVRIMRVDPGGPVWTVSDAYLFQDNFSTDGTTTGAVRVDMAADILPLGAPGIRPGDSTVVNVSESNFGLSFHMPGVPASGPAVYGHVRNVGTKSGAAISGDPLRWPAVVTGSEWTVLRFDSVFATTGTPVSNRFCVDLNDNLYTPPDTIFLVHIARWTGTRWETLGSGTDWRIKAIAIDGANVYVGGNFDHAGGLPVNNIALWNGSTWSALGSGFTAGDVEAIAIGGGTLYAGGVNFISRWNGVAWPSLGVVNGAVYEIAASSGDVYIGGSFTTVGGVAASRVAKWNGSAWSALAEGVSWTVRAIAVDGSDVYVGGEFGVAGQVAAIRIARWDGSTWHAMGDGMNATVRAIVAENGIVYAAGDFLTAGGQPANHVARWEGTAWSALGSGTNGRIETLLLTDDDLFIGGLFYTAGAKRSYLFGQWNRDDSGVATNVPRSPEHALYQNYPNPFNPGTTIRYAITEPTRVTLRIYNAAGQLVRTLIDDEQTPSADGFAVRWDATDDAGQHVASGVYFYQLVTSNFTEAKKMIVLR